MKYLKVILGLSAITVLWAAEVQVTADKFFADETKK